MSVGLAGLEAPQVKQQQAELVAVQDILVIEGEFQDVLGMGMGQEEVGAEAGQEGGHPGGASPSGTCTLAGPHLHSAMDPVVEGLVPLRVPAVCHHPCLGLAGGCCGQPQLHVAIRLGQQISALDISGPQHLHLEVIVWVGFPLKQQNSEGSGPGSWVSGPISR